jgi:hypothetical protein
VQQTLGADMNASLSTYRLFEAWLRQAAERAALRRATEAERSVPEAELALRQRAARYEREQPGYAADLRAALARTEHEIAIGPDAVRSL